MGNLGSSSSMDVDQQLIASSKEGNCSAISQLIVDGADPNYQDDKSNTALMWASAMGHLQCVDTLINCHARLEDRDNDGYTALHWAVAQKQLNIVIKLIEREADINALNKVGDTPLHRAAHYDAKEIASELMKAGAKLNIQNSKYQTPFDKSRTKAFKIWFYNAGGRPNSSEFQIEGLMVPNDEKTSELSNNKTGNKMENDKMKEEDKMKFEMQEQVKLWLKELTMLEYFEKFVCNGYDRFEACIYEMSKDELKEIGVKMGHIKIILNSINEMKSREKIYNEQSKFENQPGAPVAQVMVTKGME